MTIVVAKIVGLEPGLMLHPFGPKASGQLLASMQKKTARLKRPDKDPEKDYREALAEVKIKGKKDIFWVNALAIKCAMVRAAKLMDGITMTDARGSVFVDGDTIIDGVPALYVKGVPVKDTRHARNKSGVDLRTRVLLTQWSAEVRFSVRGALSAEQALTCLVNAGDGVGIGDWRPQTNGVHGRWSVDSAETMQVGKAA